MKKLLLIVLIGFSINASAQLQKEETPKEIIIGKTETLGTLNAELSLFISNEDTLYSFHYRDMNYEKIKVYETIFFKGNDKLISDLYDMLKKAIEADKGSELNIKLGKRGIYIKTEKMLGIKYLYLAIDKFDNVSGYGVCQLNAKQIDKLFNK